jgi:hypothetical protein
MSGNAILSGYPDVVAVDVFQGSGAKPGRIVVDTLPSVGASAFPRVTTLSLAFRGFLGTWQNIKVTRRPKVRGHKLRTVFADSRWRLKDIVLGVNYNERDCNGVLFPDTEKTIQELVQIIAGASGLPITTGALPNFKPHAPWRGKRADEALEDLLQIAGLRMVYNPISAGYVISRGDSGQIPSIVNAERMHRPGPNVGVSSVTVYSAPKTFEGRLSAQAVVFNENNEMVNVTSAHRIFNNFSDLSGVLRSRHAQSALRLWKVDAADKVILGRRALSVATGDEHPTYAAARFIKSPLSDVPQYVRLFQPPDGSEGDVQASGGGRLFISEHPYVRGQNGSVKTTANILCAWYQIQNGNLVRDAVSRSAGGSGSPLEIIVDWIRPVSSSEEDVTGDEWQTIHGQVADAIAAKHTPAKEHVRVASLVAHGGIGQLGAVRYLMSIPSRFVETSLAFNFDPVDSRGM